MERLGTMVWCSLSDDVKQTGAGLASAGFEHQTPRNDAKTALLKACKVVKKGWEIRDADIGARLDTPKTLKKADHRRFADGAHECRVALTRPKISDDAGFSTVTAMTITLAKGSASLTFEKNDISDAEFETMKSRIEAEFERAKESIDSTQLRLIISRYITGKAGCNAVTMRPFSGGVYFVPEHYRPRLDKLKSLFATQPEKMRLDAVPVYKDGDTVASVEFAVATAFEKELKGFMDMLKEETKKGISTRALESRVTAAEDIKEKIAAYSDHMVSKVDAFNKTTSRLIGLMEVRLNDAQGKTVEPFDLEAELASMGDA